MSSKGDENGEGGPAVEVAPELRSLARVELQVGQRFAERYEVEELMGRGGMGAVYRVRDTLLDEAVALKVLALPEGDAVDRFLREVRLSRRVTHPNVARTYDFGEYGGVRYLSMEYVTGASLEAILARQAPLSPGRAASVAAQVAAGLEAAHRAGIVHRDLKPANVLVNEEGRVVLTDFGIARALTSGRQTQVTGAAVGTPRYMSPEQASAKRADARSDLYSLGVILFQMVTGRVPFPADDPVAEAVARLDRPAPDVRDLVAVPERLAVIIGHCLARDPEARPQSGGELARALADAVELDPDARADLGVATETPSSSRHPSQPGAEAGGGRTPTGQTGRRATGDPALGRSSQSSPSDPYAPLCPGRQTLAVLPFSFRGPSEHDYLGAALAEELIDILSRTRGLRVLAPGATHRFSGDRDPARVGEELGADVVVDGTAQLAGSRVRLSARLVEAESGVQRWSERFDSAFEDVFALQESLGRRLAESLRLELDAAVYRRAAPPEAIELYLRARRLLRGDINQRAAEALDLLDRSLELSPEFVPALPAHALASVRAWWQISGGSSAERAGRAAESVARARERAAELAETELAAAMFAVQNGQYGEAAPALAKALEIAPTLAEAHQYLGQLQAEAGHRGEARRRLELALELDPSLHACRLALGRIAALDGDYERACEFLRAIESAGAASPFATYSSGLRFALWRGNRADAERAYSALAEARGPEVELGRRVFAIAVGQGTIEDAHAARRELEASFGNERMSGLMRQKATEAFCAARAYEEAEAVLAEAAEGALVDLDWLRRCELLAPLREGPAYADALAKVKARAEYIWR